MTTIAFKNGVMAADTLVTRGDNHCGTAHKIVRRDTDGAVCGTSGRLRDVIKFQEWFLSGDQTSLPPVGDELEAMVAYPDGRVDEYDGSTCLGVYIGRPCPELGTLAIGSGWKAAAAAMAAGASALQAIEIAAKIDVHTKGPFQVVEVPGWSKGAALYEAQARPVRKPDGEIVD